MYLKYKTTHYGANNLIITILCNTLTILTY